MKRSDLTRKAQRAQKRIIKAKEQIKELTRQSILLSDKNQWFEEKEEDVVISRRPKVVEKQLVGRVYWKMKIEDDSGGKPFYVDRQAIVRRNGEWVNGY